MKNHIFIFLTFLLFLSFSSCQKEESFTIIDDDSPELRNPENSSLTNVDPKFIYGETDYDAARFRFSKALALALENQSVREFLKRQVLSQKAQDFDTEILYLLIKDLLVENDLSFSEVLENYDPVKGDEFYDRTITDMDPYLTILVFMNFQFELEDWNTTNEIPEVGVWYSSLNNQEIIPIINKSGGIRPQYGNELPEKIIIGTKHNETHLIIDIDHKITRSGNDLEIILSGEYCDELLEELSTNTDIIHLNNNEIIISEEELFLLNNELCNRSDPEGGGGGNGPNGEDCERDLRNTKDIIFKYKLNGSGGWNYCQQGWGEGWRLEVKHFTTFGELEQDGLISAKIFIHPDKKRHFKEFFEWHYNIFLIPVIDANKDVDINWKLLQWFADKHGMVCESRWIEVDKSDTDHQFEFSLGWKAPPSNGGMEVSFKYKLRYDPSDDVIGVTYPEYCDIANNPGYEYNLGTIAFFNQGHMDE